MNQPDDRLAAIENTKTVRGILLGGKIGAGFAGISAGLVALIAVIGWTVSFANSPNWDYLMPGTIAILLIVAFQIHHSWVPILAAPVVMLSFVSMSLLSFFMCLWFFVGGALGSAVASGVDLDPVLEAHAIEAKHARTDGEIDEQIMKSKDSLKKLKDHRLSVASSHFVVSMLALFVAAHGFFARLWLMEDAIIDTQLRLISLSERCLDMAHTANANIQAICLSVSDHDQDKFKEIAVSADQTEQALESFKDELRDLPAVGFRKGQTLSFKRRRV